MAVRGGSPPIFVFVTVLAACLLSISGVLATTGSTPSFPLPRLLPGAVGASSRTESGKLSIVAEPAGTATGCVVGNVDDPYPELTEGHLAFQGNLFNLPLGSVGDTKLCYNASTKELSDRTKFTSLPGAVQNGVLGYPEAILGENIYGGQAGHPNTVLPLPDDRVRELEASPLWVALNYSVAAPGGSPYDFAFDDWFSTLEANASSTGNVGNRIELMIWLSNDIGMYLSQTRVDVPSYLNGSRAPGTWYRDDLCMGADDLTFDYLYAPADTPPGYGVPGGLLSLNLSYILKNVASVVEAGACWAPVGTSISSLFVDNFPLGAEFYPTLSLTAQVSWSVSQMCYLVNPDYSRSTGPTCRD